eukprot:CAMPEP_0195520030 /NCGR_PEP_ID=MMETSP0794_2-20130614/15963_1 /TAXON_ID=515487 /ORGANISM="Stephanopyxis turris, Strain CCMP 815" /LENGTH=707 /DNA_ID=CAMNT_0040649299 /DNA_START=63 /DNA_END=2186 /DNA_ORIENTATION=-
MDEEMNDQVKLDVVEDDERSVSTPFPSNYIKTNEDGGSLVNLDDGDTQTICTVEKRGNFTGLHAYCNLPFGESDAAWKDVRDFLTNHDDKDELLNTQGEDQDTALHLICCRHPPIDVIEKCVEIAPEACMSPNMHGIIPLHYASLSDAKTAPNMFQVIQAMINTSPNSIHVTDHEGKSPLDVMLEHSAILNPKVVSLLASHLSVNNVDIDGRSPFHILGNRARTMPIGSEVQEDDEATVVSMFAKTEEEKMGLRGGLAYDRHRKNMQECLDVLLSANSESSDVFFDALANYPSWLHAHAVLNTDAQRIMNKVVMTRFLPSAIFLLDAYFIGAIIYAYRYATYAVIQGEGISLAWDSIVLTVGCVYFGLRAAIYMTNMSNIGCFHAWVADPWNWVDLACVALLIVMLLSINNMMLVIGDDFRILAAVTTFVLWIKVASILHCIMMEFSIFVTGIYQVGMRLPSFFLALGVLWVAFAQMFFTVFQMSSSCVPEENSDFCTVSGSYIGIYSILTGNVSQEDLRATWWLYLVFGIMALMLVFNVLVSVVSAVNHVKVKGEEIFWSNRFYFLSAIYSMSIHRNRALISMPQATDYEKGNPLNSNPMNKDSAVAKLAKGWNSLMTLLNNETIMGFIGALVGLVLATVWFIVGLVTLGACWPPQVKKMMFCSINIKREGMADPTNMDNEQIQILNNQNEIKDALKEIQGFMRLK